MCLLEVARALPYGRRDRYRVVGVLHQHAREQGGKPSFDGIRITFHKGTNSENCCMTLADGIGIGGVTSVGQTTILC